MPHAKPELNRQAVPAPVYRPQPTPIVLQRKMASGPRVHSSGSHRQPVAPPVYRLQSKKVAQPKIVDQKPRIHGLSSGRASASHLRPAPTVVQRTKMATRSGPTAPRRIHHTNVVQAYLEVRQDGTAHETRTGQIYTIMANSWVMDANGSFYYYTATHQYMTQSGLYYDPVTRMTLNVPMNSLYQNTTTGVYYYYDGEFYRQYQPQQQQPTTPQQQQPTIPHATSQISPPPSASLSTSVAPPPSPSQQTQTQTSTSSTTSTKKDNDYFRNLVNNRRQEPDPFANVRAQGTLTGSLNQLRTEALKSDDVLERAIQELVSGSHGRGAGIRGVGHRFSDGRYDESHGGHAHAEYATFQLFDELLRLWSQKGKTPKQQWLDIHSLCCKQYQFDKKPPDRDKGGGGGKGELGGSTHAPRTKIFTH